MARAQFNEQLGVMVSAVRGWLAIGFGVGLRMSNSASKWLSRHAHFDSGERPVALGVQTGVGQLEDHSYSRPGAASASF